MSDQHQAGGSGAESPYCNECGEPPSNHTEAQRKLHGLSSGAGSTYRAVHERDHSQHFDNECSYCAELQHSCRFKADLEAAPAEGQGYLSIVQTQARELANHRETFAQEQADLAQARARISELEQSHAECARTAALERAVVEAARAAVRPVIPPPLSKLWELSDVLRVLDAATATKDADA